MNNKETVAEVAKEFGKNIALMRKCKCVGVSLWNCLKFKLRFEAAHEREMEVLRRRLDAVVESRKTTCGLCPSSEKIKELERRLKVAEDALDSAWMYADKLPHQWPLPERVRTKMKNALAAIRREGGEVPVEGVEANGAAAPQVERPLKQEVSFDM